MSSTSKLLTLAEVANILGVSTLTLYRWNRAGTNLRFVKVGGQLRVRQADLDAYIESNRTPQITDR